jgi:DNA replication protein DnaC
MSDIMHARVQERLVKLRLGNVGVRLDALLSEAARREWSFLEFLDRLLAEEMEAKQRKRVVMGMQIAHFPAVKTLDTFDFLFQPTVDAKLVRELSTGRFIANGDNVLMLGPPGVGKTHLAVALGRAMVEVGHSVLFTSTTALLGALAKAESDGSLNEKLAFFSKPKLLIVDELGYLTFEKRTAHLLFQLVARRYERGSLLITSNLGVTQWGEMFSDEVTAAALLDRLLHHSHILNIKGDSYRLKQKRKSGALTPTVPPPVAA